MSEFSEVKASNPESVMVKNSYQKIAKSSRYMAKLEYIKMMRENATNSMMKIKRSMDEVSTSITQRL